VRSASTLPQLARFACSLPLTSYINIQSGLTVLIPFLSYRHTQLFHILNYDTISTNNPRTLSAIFKISPIMPEIVWTCCKCNYSPMLVALYPKCISCGKHEYVAGCCATEEVKDREDNLLENAMVDHSRAREQGALRFYTPFEIRSHAPGRNNLLSSGQSNISLTHTSSPNDAFTSQPPPEIASTMVFSNLVLVSEGTLRDGNDVWYCCSCDSQSPTLGSTTSKCDNCEHLRCGNCSDEKVA
jgi:hypothetical protein